MKLKPIDVESFQFLFSLASDAMDCRIPPGVIPSLVGKTLEVEVEPGKVESITFQNHATVRMMDAVASQVYDPADRISAAGRIYHLYAMFGTDRAKPYVRECDGRAFVHPAMLQVASVHPADSEKGFAGGFFEEVARAVESMPEVAAP